MSENKNMLEKQLNLLLESFDKLSEEQRRIEFSRSVFAEIIVKRIIEMIKQTEKEEFIEAISKYEFIGDILSLVATYMEAGIDFGWTKRIEKEDENESR